MAHHVDGVLARRVDGAFFARPINHPDLRTQVAFQEELVLVTALSIRSLDALRESASAGLTAVLFRIGCSYRQPLGQVLSQIGLPVFNRLELGTLDGLLGCVAAGIGVTLLPRAVVADSTQAGGIGGACAATRLQRGRNAAGDASRQAHQRGDASISGADLIGAAPADQRNAARRRTRRPAKDDLACSVHSVKGSSTSFTGSVSGMPSRSAPIGTSHGSCR
jgi:hypothetical protein